VTNFKQEVLKQLTDQQVRFAPPVRRAEQLVRAERLLAEIDPSKRYPYQFVCWRITDFRPQTHADLLIPGDELAHDLLLLMQALSGKELPPLPPEEMPEPIVTLEEISKKFNVSTKTIRRWRRFGLVGQPMVCNGKRQVAFLQSVVDRFLTSHPERVERGSRFSQMTETERDEILRRARRLSRGKNRTTRTNKKSKNRSRPKV